jgi:hypothetical protein
MMDDEIPKDIVDLYVDGFGADMEVPDSEPIAGWMLIVPPNSGAFGFYPVGSFDKNGRRRLQRGHDLTPEAEEWAEMNLRHRYWVLGDGALGMEVYFTDEHDYIYFKMRYG